MTFRYACTAALLLATTAFVPAGAKEAKAPRAVPARSAEVLPVVPIAAEKIVLANGMTVIVHEDHATPVVTVGMWYHVGSGNETPGRTGFAHLFEHLMFNGSQNANTDWFKAMSDVGGVDINGTTSFDRTNYFQTVPKNALDRTLWLESDRMQNLLPVIDQARLDEQRKVVQNEKRQRENNPTGQVPELYYSAIYPKGHPYSWTPIGSMEDLNAASLDDVRDFFKKWYGPNNAVLVMAGDITVAEAREKAERYFGDIAPGQPIKRSLADFAPRAGHTRGAIDVATANSSLLKSWNIPGWSSRDAQLLSLWAGAWGSGEDSRLHKRLVRDLELATNVSASVTLMELGSQFTISAVTRPGVSLPRLEAAIDEEIALMLRDGIADADIEQAKFQRYSGRVKSQTSTLTKAMTLADMQLYGGDPGVDRVRQDMVNRATPAEILALARRWLSDGSYTLEIRAQPAYAATGKPADRSAPPAIGPAPDFKIPPLQQAVLSNGIKVFLAERHDAPTIDVEMRFDVGNIPDRNPASVGLDTAFGFSMLGTHNRSMLDIASEQQKIGASIGWKGGNEVTRFNLNALKLKLDESLDLYADILLNPAFPADEWDRRRKIFAASYEENKRTPTGKLLIVLPRAAVGEHHPYAATMTPAIADKLTVEDFRRFYHHWIRPDMATITVVGDTTLAEIMPKLEKRFAGWKAPAGPVPVKPPLPAPDRSSKARVIMVDQPGAASSVVAIGRQGPARSDPGFEALSLANQILGGGFVSRLNMNLREDKGWSYGAKATLTEEALLGGIGAHATVQADKTADAIREIDRELREIATTRPPTDAEIAEARNSMLLGLPASLQGTGVGYFYNHVRDYGLPDDYWNGYIQRIQTLKPAEIAAAAKRLYAPSEATWFVVGDLAKIEADVRKLNLGEVMIYDADGNRLR